MEPNDYVDKQVINVEAEIEETSVNRPSHPAPSISGKEDEMEMSSSSSNSSINSNPLNEDYGKNGNYYPDELILKTELVVQSSEHGKLDRPKRNLPEINVPEKIVFCIDVCEDPEVTPFELGDGSQYNPLYMIKRVIPIFMYNKNFINKNHQFALVILQYDNVVWLHDFTSEPREIISQLENLGEIVGGDEFDLTKLFDLLREQVTLPKFEKPNITNPPVSLRCIMIYNRSNCIPRFLGEKDSFEYFSSSEFFTIDIMYIHEDVCNTNKCQEVYNSLIELDTRGFSYIFHAVRNATRLHDDMAKLLAHPFQRPLPQKEACYKVPDFM